MMQKLQLPVSVVCLFDHKLRSFSPVKVLFEGRPYPVIKIGYHHTFRRGRTLYHVYSVASAALFFRLVFNTDTLSWQLEAVSDGETN